MRLKKILKKLSIVLIGILLLGAAVYGVATEIYGREVESEIAKIKARGEPVAMADLGKDMPTDSENAAVIYEQIFSKWPGSQGQYKDYTFEIISDEKLKSYSQSLHAARIISEVSKEDRALAEIALTRPRCRFPIDWEAGSAANFRHLSKLRILARLFAVQAIVDAEDGRMADAMHSIYMTYKISDSLKEEPSIISHLVRVAIIKIASCALCNVVEIGNVSEDDARILFDSLARIDLHPGLVKAMRGERAFGLWIYDKVRSSHDKELEMDKIKIRKGPFLYADELYFLKTMEEIIGMLDLPYRSTEWRKWEKVYLTNDNPTIVEDIGNITTSISELIMPPIIRIPLLTDDCSTKIAGSRILLALEAYRDRFGVYPATLNELSGKLGWELPIDPFSGRSFVYKAQPDSFLLYSIGSDLKDDSGVEMGKDHKGDIVWKIER